MTSTRTARTLAAITLVCGIGFAAESARAPQTPANAAAAAAAARTAARKILPDPVLLDGAAHPVEKKTEYGMLGDFELPGDENAQSNRVGGPPSGQPPSAGPQVKPAVAVKGLPIGIPGAASPLGTKGGQGAGLPGLPPIAAAGGAVGAGGIGLPPTDGGLGGGGQAGGMGQPNGAGQPNAGGQAGGSANAVPGGGEAGGQAGGIEVAELGGAGSAGGPVDGMGGRPPPVTIGDRAMRIETSSSPPNTVGVPPKQLPDGHIQEHKATGTGGKPPTSPQGPGRIEKGRTIPAGL